MIRLYVQTVTRHIGISRVRSGKQGDEKMVVHHALFIRDEYNGKWTDWQFVGTSTGKKVLAEVGKGFKVVSNRGPSHTNYKVVPSATKRRTITENLGAAEIKKYILAGRSGHQRPGQRGYKKKKR